MYGDPSRRIFRKALTSDDDDYFSSVREALRRNPLHHPQAESQVRRSAYFFTLTFGEEIEISASWLGRSKSDIRLVTYSADERSKEGCHLLLRNAALT
jgi:hypothetical protein